MKKCVVLCLIASLAVSSLILVDHASAFIATPSVPEFTVCVTDHSYDVQTTTTTTTDVDGRRINVTSPGYHVANGSIDLSIKNQPFTPYYDSDGYPINLYYRIRIKGTESADWAPGRYFRANNSTTDTVILNYLGYSFASSPFVGFGILGFSSYRINDTLSFQVEAFIGHTKTTSEPTNSMFPLDIKKVEYIGQSSGWSNIQTVRIPSGSYSPTTPTSPITPHSTSSDSSSSTSQEPTTPQGTNHSETFTLTFTLFGLDAAQFIILALLTIIVVLLVVAVLYLRGRNPLTMR